ncbi:PR domain zinc finger protein 13 [Pseudolycoriella hygida]|uniref:PR domain zinc finger protein 13 n=1 Tax=Pseudolycoriella hygida TaxID=35572 RepID=A0A9Q0MNH6_9DIPT|nr:PR domain zinc finger protein 13 [Pseudolycoriella hygida]
MVPFTQKNCHIVRPSTVISRDGNNTESSLWSVWTSNMCTDSKLKKNQQKLNNLSRRIVDSIKTNNSSASVSGCFASEFITKDTKTKPINAIDAYLTGDQVKLYYLSARSGYLQADDKEPDNTWIKNLKLSMDPHSNNVILEVSNDELRVRTIRSINANDEITLWFSEEILAAMDIPFLTPTNIRDKNNYTCNICEKTFENPNPLKIHIATDCERLSENVLWSRLETFRHRNIKPTYESSTPPCSLLHYHQTVQQRLSAFQPVRTNTQYNNASCSSSNTSSYQILPSVLNVESEQAITAAAHLETIVSNMGTSKQGHLCIYCGKLYSRKYGLKIHIRTHTGFKPLKCKYCYRPFGDPSNLNKHVRLHVQGNTVYKCTDCGKVLVRRRDLQRHIQTRHRKCDGDNDEKSNSSGFYGDVTFGAGTSESDDDKSINEMIEVE